MDEDIINTALIEDIRDYLKLKTGKLYFKHIRAMPDNIQVTCPFHKDGQENKPSATIRVTASDRAAPGLFSCFTCHEAMMIDEMVAKILGNLYNEDEVEAKLGLKSMDFSLRQDDNNIIIDTVGYGHGVGMSQYGAEGMALEGYSYRDILSHYYVGTSIKKIKN